MIGRDRSDRSVQRPQPRERYPGSGEINSGGLSPIVPLRVEGTKPPLFLIHGMDGTLRPFQDLVRHLEPDQPIYGVLAQSLVGETKTLLSVEELATYYIQTVQAVQPTGPYHFLGFSFGGLVAFEIGRQLRSRGQLVGMLALLDTLWMSSPSKCPAPLQETSRLPKLVKQLLSSEGHLYAKELLVRRSLRIIYTLLLALGRPIPRFLVKTSDVNWFAAQNYVPQFYPGSVTLFPASESTKDPRATTDLWARLAGEGIVLHYIPGGHKNVLSEPNVRILAKTLTNCLANQ
jgi:thioesterase domain-containing protein